MIDSFEILLEFALHYLSHLIQRYRFHIYAWKEDFSHFHSVNETLIFFFFQFLSSHWISLPSQHLKLPPHSFPQIFTTINTLCG